MAGIRDLVARLAELEGIPSRISKEVADGIGELVAAEFAGQHDPYGKPWAPLKESTVRRKGHSRILSDSGLLSGSTEARPSAGAGVGITSIEYGTYHQTGTKFMVARKILPDGPDLPKAWSAVIDRAAQKAFAKVLK